MTFHLVVLVSAALLCSAVSSFRLGDSSGDLAGVLAKVNQEVQNVGLSEATTPDQSFSSILSQGSIKNVKAGKLNTFAVRGNAQHINKTEIGDVAATYFDISIGLDEFYVSYDYEYTFLALFGGHGSAKVTVGENAAELVGTVTTNKGQSSCTAVLQSVTLTKLSSFNAEIFPQTFINNIISIVLNLLHNYVISSDISTFNDIFSDVLKSNNFQKTFSEVVCKSINVQ